MQLERDFFWNGEESSCRNVSQTRLSTDTLIFKRHRETHKVWKKLVYATAIYHFSLSKQHTSLDVDELFCFSIYQNKNHSRISGFFHSEWHSVWRYILIFIYLQKIKHSLLDGGNKTTYPIEIEPLTFTGTCTWRHSRHSEP